MIRIFNLIALLLCVQGFGQVLEPVDWKFSTETLDNNKYKLVFEASIDEGWHVYSITHVDGGIGIPTEFTFEGSSIYEKNGKLKEIGKLHDEYNEFFEEQQRYYANKIRYEQIVTLNKSGEVKGEIMYQVCDEEKCLPPEYVPFSFTLKYKKEAEAVDPVVLTPDEPESLNALNGDINELDVVTTEDDIVVTDEDSIIKEDESLIEKNKLTEKEIEAVAPVPIEIEGEEDASLCRIFILGMLGGFAALLMPCIFPMIPLTVSIFTKQSSNRKSGIGKALLYGLSIIVIYTLVGLAITAAYGPDALNAIATNPWVNIAFFVLFFVFALSFLGLFEITLPSSWVNKADKGADKSGLIGIFFMALTLALVSFSCTGPIIGTLLVNSSETGEKLGPAMGMLGFSFALALPFTLFAIFPSWLNSLPRSGGWLNTVKVTLGFIELAFAFKFLSNADLVWQAEWLQRELFLSIWIGIFFTCGLYLLNMFATSHDSDTKSIGVFRLLLGVLSFITVFYMLPGLWGAPLKYMSGLIPPKNYSESPMGFYGSVGSVATASLPDGAKYGPHGIPVFHDLEEANTFAKATRRPILIDFTGDACANCRKVEDNVWSDPRVQKILTNDVVLASLYVDRRVDLPEEEKVYSEEKKRKLRTIGDKWSAFQIREFKSNSQPLYIMVDEDLERYSKPMGAELDVDIYIEWLKNGIANYKK